MHPWWITRDGTFRHRWHEWQMKVWRSPRRFLAMIAGSGGGKTSYGAPWLVRECWRHPGEDFIACEPTWAMVERVMVPVLRKIVEPLGGRVMLGKGLVEVPTSGELARIWLISADRPERAEGIHARAAWADEAGQYSGLMFETLQRRVGRKQGRILYTTTPYDLGPLKVEVFDRWASGDPDYLVVQFASTANPTYPVEEFERARATMPAWRFRMFYLGQFDQPPGLVYGDYHDWPRTEVRDEGLGHLVPDFAIPPEWPRYVGVDFGAVNQATLWVAEDPKTHVCYAYRETWEGNLTTREHCERFLDAAAGVNFQMAFGGAPSEQQQRWDWGAHGVAVQRPRVVDVEIGIDRVTELFKARRLFVFESLRQTRAMLGSYSRVVDDNGQVTEKIKDKEKAHLLDCLRYVGGWLVHLAPVAEEAA